MPLYTYRREDGTTFDIQQKFADAPLTVDPATGQKVVRVIQAAGIIFKGSGFYVNDSKSSSKTSTTSKSTNGNGSTGGEAKTESGTKTEASETKSEKSTDAKTSETKPVESKSSESSTPKAVAAD